MRTARLETEAARQAQAAAETAYAALTKTESRADAAHMAARLSES